MNDTGTAYTIQISDAQRRAILRALTTTEHAEPAYNDDEADLGMIASMFADPALQPSPALNGFCL